MNTKTKLVALVGMCGAGKSVVADAFVNAGYQYLRFGQVVLDETIRRGLPTSETLERDIRGELREKHGMAAMALLNIPKFDELLAKGDVVGDGLYSWSEYKVLKERYGDRFLVVSVNAPPKMRYARLLDRASQVTEDPTRRYRSFSEADARARDYAEIERIEKGGPIAMADYTILNSKDLPFLESQIGEILKELSRQL